ncbi:MAG TPA: hypothetical protein VGL18_15015 [Actinomycetota bacterium]|jgi:uncharacterized protein YidB (DUF937 family)
MVAAITTPEQIAQLEKLMKILKDDTKRGQFKSQPNDTADAAGVNRNLGGIQDTIDELAAKWSVDELKLLAELNDKMFTKGLRETTTGIMAKQV